MRIMCLAMMLACALCEWCPGQQAQPAGKRGEKAAAGKAEAKADTGDLITNSIGMKLALIPPGEFSMGSPSTESGRTELEQQHRVRLTRPMYVGVYEVTQGEYEKVMGQNPSYFSPNGPGKDKASGQDTSRFPVESVTWDQARDFCTRLSALPEEKAASRVYRLPTEAEWEYACRAGTTGPFSFGSQLSGPEANYGFGAYGTSPKGPKLGRPTTVGSYPPNTFGLCDMHGNVWEWCEDWFGYYPASKVDNPTGPQDGTSRIVRGGSWGSVAEHCRSAFRRIVKPTVSERFIGFRVVFSPPEEKKPVPKGPMGGVPPTDAMP